MPHAWQFTSHFLTERWFWVVGYCALNILSLFAAVVLVPRGVAHFLERKTLKLLAAYLGLTCGLFALEFYVRQSIQNSFLLYTRNTIYLQVLAASEENYVEPNAATLCQAYTWLPLDHAEVLQYLMSESLYAGVTLLVAVVYFARIHWSVALPNVAAVLLYALVVYGFWDVIYQRAMVEERTWYETTEFVDAQLQNLLNIHTANEGPSSLRQVQIRNNQFHDAKTSVGTVELAASSLCAVISATVFVSTLFLLNRVGTLSSENLVAACGTALSVFAYLLHSWETIAARLAHKQAESDYTYQRLPTQKTKQATQSLPKHIPAVPELHQGIELSNVTFEYESAGGGGVGGRGEVVALRFPNWRFPANRTAVIVGASGTGKSTLVKLILKCWPATTGTVLFCGEDIQQLDTVWYRSQFAYMNQNSVLWGGSVKENILRSATAAGERRLRELLEVYKITVFDTLDGRLEFDVGALGKRLSMGQQKITRLLRTLLTEAAVYILDEPLTSLDSVHRERVARMVVEVLHGKTVIIISHQTELVDYADQVYRLES